MEDQKDNNVFTLISPNIPPEAIHYLEIKGVIQKLRHTKGLLDTMYKHRADIRELYTI